MPRLRRAIAEFFSERPSALRHSTRVNPDLAIVSGAAIQAGIATNSWPLRVAAVDAPASVRKIRL